MAERRFAAAGRTDERKRFTGGNIQIDMREHASAAFVGKRNVRKADVAFYVLQRPSVGAVLDIRLDIHNLAET